MNSRKVTAAGVVGSFVMGAMGAIGLPGSFAHAAVAQDGCRAAGIRVGTTEAVVANAPGTPCVASKVPLGSPIGTSTPGAGPVAVPDPFNLDVALYPGLVEVGAAYARTDPTAPHPLGKFGHIGKAEAGANDVGLFIGASINYPPYTGSYTYIDVLTSQATAQCSAGVPSFYGKSYVGRVERPAAATVEPVGPGPVDLPLAGGGILHFNYQVLSDKDGNGVKDTVTQRALFIERPGFPDIVIAESLSTAAGC